MKFLGIGLWGAVWLRRGGVARQRIGGGRVGHGLPLKRLGLLLRCLGTGDLALFLGGDRFILSLPTLLRRLFAQLGRTGPPRFLLKREPLLPDPLPPRLPAFHLRRYALVLVLSLAQAPVVSRVGLLRGLQQLVDLLLQPGLPLLHPGVAHRLVLARAGLHLGAVYVDVLALHHPRRLTEAQNLKEQCFQLPKVPAPETGDDGEVRLVVPAHHPEGDVLDAGPRDPAR